MKPFLRLKPLNLVLSVCPPICTGEAVSLRLTIFEAFLQRINQVSTEYRESILWTKSYIPLPLQSGVYEIPFCYPEITNLSLQAVYPTWYVNHRKYSTIVFVSIFTLQYSISVRTQFTGPALLRLLFVSSCSLMNARKTVAGYSEIIDQHHCFFWYRYIAFVVLNMIDKNA